MADVPTRALAGMRVLDISTFFAAPQISAILGDFGADVVKVEPPAGEASRDDRRAAQRPFAHVGVGVAQQAHDHA